MSQDLSDVRFLTVAEVADMMRVSKMTVYRMVHSGELPAIRFGRSFRVPESAVAAVLRIGIADVGWLTTGFGAKVVVLLVYVWQNFGFTFLLFIGGLAAIPSEVYEASSLDGAAGWTQFRMITLPLVSPTLLVASVMAIINALQIFDQPWVLSRGGPGDETRTAVMVIYESAFRELDFGGASAIGIVLTLLIMLVTAIQFRLSRRFVFYG
jgi:multiple sugar transport system permease protein